MQTSKAGIELIKRFEGKFLTAYHGAADRPGLLTIGYGHTDAAGPPKVRSGMKVTEKEAEDILRSDLRSVELAVSRLVKVPLNQNQFDALVSFTFNLGEGNLSRSTLLRRLNSGDYDISNEFLKWNKANGKTVKGLTNRRTDEAKLWNTPGATGGKEISQGTIVVGGAAAAATSPAEYIPYIVFGTLVVIILVEVGVRLYRMVKE